MTPYDFDTETYPIHPGLLAPPVVCLQDADGIHTGREAIRARFVEKLRDPSVLFVAHSAAYDMAVLGEAFPDLLPEIFAAYEADRVVCTKVREKLIRIAQGRSKAQGYSLADCCDAHKIAHGYNVDAQGQKAEAWRVRYAELEHVPVKDWPADAVRYAELDVTNLRALREAQERYAARMAPDLLADQYRQTRADFWLHLSTCWGLMTDPEAVEAFVAKVEEEHVQARALLTRVWLVRPNGSKDTKKAKARMEKVRRDKDLDIPRTATGAISLDAEACEGSGDPVLVSYARYGRPKSAMPRGWPPTFSRTSTARLERTSPCT